MHVTKKYNMSGMEQKITMTTVNENDFPLIAALSAEASALAVIVHIEGSSYRRCGTAMVVDATGRCWGNLSSGCIDKDIALKAKAAIEGRKTIRIRYGRGSPYWDLPLPCGGALDVQIFPFPDKAILSELVSRLKQRKPSQLSLSETGKLSLEPSEHSLQITILPKVRVLVFGTGIETICFTELAQTAGCRVDLFSPDTDILDRFPSATSLVSNNWPEGISIDERSAVVTFFHDHDREPAILNKALKSRAFFIGAQGSRRAHIARCESLLDLGCSPKDLERLVFPFGLIPSTRDPQSLAVSVLAHIFDQIKKREDIEYKKN